MVTSNFMLTTGEILRRERVTKGLSLEEIEKTTKIRKKNLTAIEQNDWRQFPSKTYILGVIKSYGKYLNLDEDKLSAIFRREYEQQENIKFKTRVSRKLLTSEAKRVFIFIILGIICVFALYFGYQLKIFLSPPTLTILKPTQVTFKREDKINLIGQTEKNAIVLVNGERVFLDGKNIFKTTLPLTKEKNEVTIEVTGANGRKTVVKRIFYKKQ